jgi:phosphoenolpyruvate synthase/pyruvate phosphate dikinase
VPSNSVISLDELGKRNVSAAGGNGANPGEIIKIGISDPNGFVVTTSFDNFIQMYNLGNRIREIVVGENALT